jgi:hypothetical protein
MIVTSSSVRPETDLVDASFDSSKAFNSFLYMEVDPHRFKYTVFDMKKSRYHLLKVFSLSPEESIPANLVPVYETQPLLKTDYRGVRVIFNNDKSVIVPKSLFDENEAEAYFSMQHELGEHEMLLIDHLRNSETVNIYAADKPTYDFMKTKHGGFKYFHSSSLFIETLYIKFRKVQEDGICVNVTDDFIQVCCIQSKKIRFFNSFPYKTPEEVLYHILNVSEQLGFNLKEFQLMFMGNVEKGTELYELVQKYISNILFSKRQKNVQFSTTLNAILEHEHFALFNLNLCE